MMSFKVTWFTILIFEEPLADPSAFASQVALSCAVTCTVVSAVCAVNVVLLTGVVY